MGVILQVLEKPKRVTTIVVILYQFSSKPEALAIACLMCVNFVRQMSSPQIGQLVLSFLCSHRQPQSSRCPTKLLLLPAFQQHAFTEKCPSYKITNGPFNLPESLQVVSIKPATISARAATF